VRYDLNVTGKPWRVATWIVVHLLRAAWLSTMVLVPLFGFWLASSLAAYANATQWLALLVGLLLFPVLPLGWDAIFVWRRSKKPPTKPILTRLDRLVLRTLVVNGVFLTAMFWAKPQTAFRALAVRGDWIVDGHDGPIASAMRSFLLGVADRFERRWSHTSTDYGASDVAPHIDIPPPATLTGWPETDDVDAQVTGIPDEAQSSPEAVGRYLADRISDKRRLAKAVHDYVALRLTYDHHTLELIERKQYESVPSQEADAVFRAHTGVCAGYAKLFAAIGKAAGLEVAYITGYARDSQLFPSGSTDSAIVASLQGYGHAWNAVKLDGTWRLVDVTWDDHDDKISRAYLFTPPNLFGYQHLPEDRAWQLVQSPLTPGDFVRQPLLTPIVGQLGVVLESPNRSQVTVDGDIEIELDNPFRAKLVADAVVAGSKESRPCAMKPSEPTHVTITCELGSGQFEVRLFGTRNSAASSLPYFGSIQVNSH
jgi:transglutaminase-like putative cysteine protease